MTNPASQQGIDTVPSLGEPKKFKVPKKSILFGSLILFIGLLGAGALWFNSRYKYDQEMEVKLKELSNIEYPANPAGLSKNFQRYGNRELRVIQRDDTHFDFVLEPTNEKTAKIVIKNVDLSLLIPKAPEWTKQDENLELIAFVEREWNRQQISFPVDSEHIEVSGGDGFEKENLTEVALARNCINAGLWEVLLSFKEDDKKGLYYQGWFTLPMGHYKNVFEKINNLSYWKHWWKLEHWQDPSGTVVKPNLLREVIDEREVTAKLPLDEEVIVSGEQVRKVRTTLASNLRTWGDFYSGKNEINFATFRPPGFYDPNKLHHSEYWRIGKFEKAILRDIKPVGVKKDLQELELVFSDTKTGEQNRLYFSGIDFKELPQLAIEDYPKGLYMPMGIGVGPFYQAYEELKKNPPYESPYFSVLLDSNDGWIDHHKVAVDGAAMHLDKDNPDLLHLYLLSYERNTLVGHLYINLK